MEPCLIEGAYFALPYNPYEQKEKYSWSFPARWFNMQEDEVILIGDEFWEKIGGIGTYQTFINAVNELGQKYKTRIYREFLGIEPPKKDVTVTFSFSDFSGISLFYQTPFSFSYHDLLSSLHPPDAGLHHCQTVATWKNCPGIPARRDCGSQEK
jgi:hypothetical protein